MRNSLATLLISVTFLSVSIVSQGIASEADPCGAFPESVKIAQDAGKIHEKKLAAIPGVIAMEVDNCSELESVAATETKWVCGLFVWFKDSKSRAVFHATNALWGGYLSLPFGKQVPLCSRVGSGPRNVRRSR